ncbi:MAG TPA: hypothetical protein VKA49_06510 [Flavitalea sp.]|nr:hypothetical protein [Flavitalea sp.]
MTDRQEIDILIVLHSVEYGLTNVNWTKSLNAHAQYGDKICPDYHQKKKHDFLGDSFDFD